MAKTTTTATKENKLKDIIGPTDPKIDLASREKLVTARVGMLLRCAFFGNLATRMRLVNADDWLATAATDGRHFYYNSRFVQMLSIKELEFLFGHEILHAAYDHMARRDSRDPQLFNIACDYAVNQDLVKHKVGTLITTVPALFDKKYEGLSAEQIYEILYENAEKIDIGSLLDQLLDEHMDGEGEGDDSKSGDQDGSGKGPVKLSEEERRAIRDELREAMIAAAQQSGVGDVPSGVRRLLEQLTEPKMNWREMLRMQLESTIRSDFTWMKPSKRGWHMDAIMPGMKNSEMIDIAIALDTSGSMSEPMLRDFLSEVQGIMEQFDAYKIHLFTFDTKVYNPQCFDSENLESLTEYEIMGGGGTSFECVFEYLKEEQIEPKKLVFLSDLEVYSFGDENYCDTLFIGYGNPTKTAPYGQTVHYE